MITKLMVHDNRIVKTVPFKTLDRGEMFCFGDGYFVKTDAKVPNPRDGQSYLSMRLFTRYSDSSYPMFRGEMCSITDDSQVELIDIEMWIDQHREYSDNASCSTTPESYGDGDKSHKLPDVNNSIIF